MGKGWPQEHDLILKLFKAMHCNSQDLCRRLVDMYSDYS